MVLIFIVAVILFVALGANASPPSGGGATPHDEGGGEHPNNLDGEKSTGGGIDMGTVGEVGGGIVTLGGTILGALGVGGGGTAATGVGVTAAGGGVASGGTVAGGASTEAGASIGSGAVAGGAAAEAGTDAAFLAVSGVSTGLEAAAATSPLILAAVVIITWVVVDNEAAKAAQYWSKLSANKRRLYFARWFRWEERAVQAYLEKLGDSRSYGQGAAAVPHTKAFASTIDDVDIGGFRVDGYYVDSVSDSQALTELPKVRALARWAAILEDYRYNLATSNYWTALEDKPIPGALDSTKRWNQLGQNPGMRDEDFWRLAEDYVKLQPFAATRYEAVAQPGAGASLQRDSSALPQASTLTRSYQPAGKLTQSSWGALTEVSGKLLGSAYGPFYAGHSIMGYARGAAVCTGKDWTLAYPGTEGYTKELIQRCGIPWPVSLMRCTDNQLRWLAVEPELGVSLDLYETRRLNAAKLYPPNFIY